MRGFSFIAITIFASTVRLGYSVGGGLKKAASMVKDFDCSFIMGSIFITTFSKSDHDHCPILLGLDEFSLVKGRCFVGWKTVFYLHPHPVSNKFANNGFGMRAFYVPEC